MSLVRLHNVSKSYDSRLVLRQAFFHMDQNDRVGLIGKNGAGKTTVLRLILGQEEPTEGTIEVNEDVRIGYFSQFSELSSEMTVQDVLEGLFADIHAIEEELLEIEAALQEPPEESVLGRLLARQSALFEAMDRRDGWTYHRRIDTVLTKLGFSDIYRKRPMNQLSGGWRNRAALAQIMLAEPDVLLLDEPTNYLDVQGLEWLEEWCQKLRGGMIVVSHDRHFLNAVVNRIIEIENYHFQEYQGNFTQYVLEKPMRAKTLERQFIHEEELLALEAEAIIDQREAAKNPSQALKRKLANVKKSTAPRMVDRIVTDIYKNLYVSRDLCRVERISKAYDHQVLFRDLTFEVHQGDRIVIVGHNGCGKTTLLQVLAGGVEPDSGRIVWCKAADLVYYNQVFSNLDLNDTITHAVNVAGLAYSVPRKQVDQFLSLLQFSDMDLRQRIGALSGGQRARVALARCLLSGASMIILDEPTNHLDMTSTQVMERALFYFPGAVVVASHDRFFIDKIATRLLVFEQAGCVREINGNWTTWQSNLSEFG